MGKIRNIVYTAKLCKILIIVGIITAIVFGTYTGISYASDVFDGLGTTFDKLLGQVKDSVFGKVLEVPKKVINSVVEFFKQIPDAFSSVGKDVDSFANDQVKNVVKGFNVVGDFATDQANNVVNGINTAGNVVGDFASDQGKNVVKGFNTAGSAVGDFASDQGKNVVNGFNTAGNAVNSFAKEQERNVVGGVNTAGKSVVSGFESAGSFFSDQGKTIDNNFKSVGKDIEKEIASVLIVVGISVFGIIYFTNGKPFAENYEDAAADISTAGKTASDFVSEQGNKALNEVKSAGKVVGDFASDQGKNAANEVKSATNDAFKSAGNAVSNIASEQGQKAINGVKSTVNDAVNSAVGDFSIDDIGKDLVRETTTGGYAVGDFARDHGRNVVHGIRPSGNAVVIIATISSVGYTFYSQPVVSLACNKDQFKCTEDGKCIQKKFRCDGEVDCRYKSDELNCPIEVPIYYQPDDDQTDDHPNNRAPQVEVNPNHNILIQGTDFEIFCKLTEGSSAQFMWSKRNGELANNVYVHGQFLKISKVTPENDGFYICLAENNAGKDQIEMFIEVEKREAPIMVIKQAKYKLKTGESIRFDCKAIAGHPTPTITWKFQNNNRLSPHSVILPMYPGFITITSATIHDSGVFECYAENVVGSFRTSTIVEVEE
ncbi:unnamed protein product [Diamesa tonsa]